jgi:hypothetical protein
VSTQEKAAAAETLDAWLRRVLSREQYKRHHPGFALPHASERKLTLDTYIHPTPERMVLIADFERDPRPDQMFPEEFKRFCEARDALNATSPVLRGERVFSVSTVRVNVLPRPRLSDEDIRGLRERIGRTIRVADAWRHENGTSFLVRPLDLWGDP